MRPITTLFLLQSVDGKISTGSSDILDVDKDFPNIPIVKDGLYQYYDIEQQTDLWSLNSGRVMSKLGVNSLPSPTKTIVNFVYIDNSHLTSDGVDYCCKKSNLCVIVTENKNHPAFKISHLYDNLKIIYMSKLNLKKMLDELYKLGCERITIQTGGTLNSLFVREKLIDYIDIVVAPILIGGSNTASLVDGKSITSTNELNRLLPLVLIDATVLNHGYLRLRYRSL